MSDVLWYPGDIGICPVGTSAVERLISVGEFLHGFGKASKYIHAFVVTSYDGDTVEAQAQGVVRMNVSEHVGALRCPFPLGVDPVKVVNFAESQLGSHYDYRLDVLLGIDSLARGLNLHHHWPDSWICSELAAASWIAGGWKSPRPASATYPADFARYGMQS